MDDQTLQKLRQMRATLTDLEYVIFSQDDDSAKAEIMADLAELADEIVVFLRPHRRDAA